MAKKIKNLDKVEALLKEFGTETANKILATSVRKNLKPIALEMKTKVSSTSEKLSDDIKLRKVKSDTGVTYKIHTTKKTKLFASIIEFGRPDSYQEREWFFGMKSKKRLVYVKGIDAMPFMLSTYHSFKDDLPNKIYQDFIEGVMKRGKGYKP